MKPGDLVKYASSTGIAIRKLQHDNDKDCKENWAGHPAWWVLFINQTKPHWAYEDELTLVKKGN